MNSFKTNSVIILGSGTSTGIPIVGCYCSVCTSLDHRDQRMRTSLFIETKKGKRILVDTSPDLRTQLLNNKISDIDFVIITHEHADHLHGIDDLRPLCFGPPQKEIPLYTTARNKKIIEERFNYIFKRSHHSKPILGGGIPSLTLNEVELMREVTIENEIFTFFTYPHGHSQTMGFVHDGFAYVVDCFELPKELELFLTQQKLQLLFIDCLQRANHTTHLTVNKSFHYIQKIAPKKAGLIHISHDLGHQYLENLALERFGENVFPLYDEQKFFY